MRPDLPELLPLICPRCRTMDAHGRYLHTVAVRAVLHEADGEIITGELQCENDTCRARYPIVDGIPIVVPDVGALLEAQAVAAHSDGRTEVQTLLARHGSDAGQLPRLMEHLSIYADAHWGDCTTSPPGESDALFGFAPLSARLRDLAPARRTVELGCSVGRGLYELAVAQDGPGSERAIVGIDLHLGALRLARRILAGGAADYARRTSGRHYATATVRGVRARPDIALLCGDVLDPPLAPACFDRVVALNVLDSVRDPRQLLSVADGLVRAGGELVLAAPYSWQSDVVDDGARPDEADPAGWLRRTLSSGTGLRAPYALADEAEVEWILRRDQRSRHVYRCHYVRAIHQAA